MARIGVYAGIPFYSAQGRRLRIRSRNGASPPPLSGAEGASLNWISEFSIKPLLRLTAPLDLFNLKWYHEIVEINYRVDSQIQFFIEFE